MPEVFQKLGVDWKLLLSQGVNFLVLLSLLTFLLYKPLLRVMHQRKKNVESAIKIVKEAEKKISEAEIFRKKKIAEAEEKAITIIKIAEKNASIKKNEILSQAKLKSSEMIKETLDSLERYKLEALENLVKQAKILIRDTITKVVSLKPEQIDERLIIQAIEAIKKEKNL